MFSSGLRVLTWPARNVLKASKLEKGFTWSLEVGVVLTDGNDRFADGVVVVVRFSTAVVGDGRGALEDGKS